MPKNLNLTNNTTEVLIVTIGDKDYKIPLATSLPYKKVKSLMGLTKLDDEAKIDAFIGFFKEYIPEKVIDELPMSALTELAKAWSGATEKDGGESLGE